MSIAYRADIDGLRAVADPDSGICKDGLCPIIQQGHSIFKDDNYVSYFGSLLIGNSFRFD